MSLILTPITSIPDINPGDNISKLIFNGLKHQNISLQNNDIIVITQKIISKAEDRFVNLKTVRASKKALELAKLTKKKPELVELIIRESRKIIRINRRTIITEHQLGFISANAGIDHSNVRREEGETKDWFLLLPKDPDYSARKIRTDFSESNNVDIGVIIVDSHGRAWRYGTVGTMIGTAGVPALVDLRGKKDLYG